MGVVLIALYTVCLLLTALVFLRVMRQERKRQWRK